MPVTVKTITLWRKELDNQVGVLARTLDPLEKAGAKVQVLMAYRYPGNEAKAAIELYPVSGKKLTASAIEAGLSASSIPALLVEGDNRPGWLIKSRRPSRRPALTSVLSWRMWLADATRRPSGSRRRLTPKRRVPSSGKRKAMAGRKK